MLASRSGAECNQEYKFTMGLTHILDQMNPNMFQVVAELTVEYVNNFGETRAQINSIIGLVMQRAVQQPQFAKQYAELCQYLVAYIQNLHSSKDVKYEWIINDNEIDRTVRSMIIEQINDLFDVHARCANKTKISFFAVMVLIAELYNVGLIKRNLVIKGVFEALLPPKNLKLTALDLEGICCLLQHCGQKLDTQAKKYVDKYIYCIMSHANTFDSHTREIVEELKGLRKNGWKGTIPIAQKKEPQIHKGRCKTFYPLKRYGFITVNDGSGLHGDVFVHCSDMNASGFEALVKGETVLFEAVRQENNGRCRAINVTALNDTSVQRNGSNKGINMTQGRDARPSKEVSDWFRKIRKSEYINVFVHNGFDDLNAIKCITKDHMKQIGVTKLGHIALIWREAQKID